MRMKIKTNHKTRLTPSIPNAALASSEDVSRKYSRMPFLRRQNGGTRASSIGDEMPSAVRAAEGAIVHCRNRLFQELRQEL